MAAGIITADNPSRLIASTTAGEQQEETRPKAGFIPTFFAQGLQRRKGLPATPGCPWKPGKSSLPPAAAAVGGKAAEINLSRPVTRRIMRPSGQFCSQV